MSFVTLPRPPWLADDRHRAASMMQFSNGLSLSPTLASRRSAQGSETNAILSASPGCGPNDASEQLAVPPDAEFPSGDPATGILGPTDPAAPIGGPAWTDSLSCEVQMVGGRLL